MSHYYALIASLPHLAIDSKAPFSSADYLEKCAAFLNKQEMKALNRLLNKDTEPAFSSETTAWKSREIQLRNAIARQRAQTRGVDARPFLQPHIGYSGILENRVAEVLACAHPDEMELRLDKIRWDLAEELIDQDFFGFSKLAAYGIQLQLVERWSRMDAETGRKRLEQIIRTNIESEEAAVHVAQH